MPTRHDAHVLIAGGGATGGGLAQDLALRGLRVTLVDRGELTSGTTGRRHGLLHSGARYASGDREAGVECIRVALVGRNIAARHERTPLWTATAIATVAAIFAALHILGAL